MHRNAQPMRKASRPNDGDTRQPLYVTERDVTPMRKGTKRPSGSHGYVFECVADEYGVIIG